MHDCVASSGVTSNHGRTPAAEHASVLSSGTPPGAAGALSWHGGVLHVYPLPVPGDVELAFGRLASKLYIHKLAATLVTLGLRKYVVLLPLAMNVSSTRPSQSSSAPLHSSGPALVR